MSGQITIARRAFHESLVQSGLLSVSEDGVASNADKSQSSSKAIALHIASALDAQSSEKHAGQKSGKLFEMAVSEFVRSVFPNLGTLRPGKWEVETFGSSRGEYHLARYVPYRHLDNLADAIKANPTLSTVLGNSYEISPDVVVLRAPEPDDVINRDHFMVDDSSAQLSPIRRRYQNDSIVHAVISCKWTLRSDRAQNARSEALNIIRNRKGRTPHISVVTAEPSPSRIASLALGTGDMDVIYHFALPELVGAVAALNNDEAASLLDVLITGDRLKDISDLPLDLTV